METREFVLSRVSWHEVTDKITVAPIEALLNDALRLENYGSGVKGIYFTYSAVQPSNLLHPNEALFDRKNGIAKIVLGLDYQSVVNASPERTLEMMAKLFLISLDFYIQWNIPDFDIDSFRHDVEKLFASKGWLASMPFAR